MTIKEYKNRPNNFGVITGVTITGGRTPVYSIGGQFPDYLPAPVEIRFEGVVIQNEITNLAMQDWMGMPSMPFYKKEWRCLYCGGVNVVDSMKCVHCNAPRNYLLG